MGVVKIEKPKTPSAGAEEEGKDDSVETDKSKILCLPGVSEKIERGCRQLGVHAVFRSGHKLRQSLVRVNINRQLRSKESCTRSPVMKVSMHTLGKLAGI